MRSGFDSLIATIRHNPFPTYKNHKKYSYSFTREHFIKFQSSLIIIIFCFPPPSLLEWKTWSNYFLLFHPVQHLSNIAFPASHLFSSSFIAVAVHLTLGLPLNLPPYSIKFIIPFGKLSLPLLIAHPSHFNLLLYSQSFAYYRISFAIPSSFFYRAPYEIHFCFLHSTLYLSSFHSKFNMIKQYILI